jgi:uncharacterized integral membrane protein
MKAIAWLFRLAFFLLALWFALKNTTPVTVRLTESIAWTDVPLIAVMLACLVAGALTTVIVLAPRIWRGSRAERAARTHGPAPAGTTPPRELAGDRVADAARNIGAVGQWDADTRYPR